MVWREGKYIYDDEKEKGGFCGGERERRTSRTWFILANPRAGGRVSACALYILGQHNFILFFKGRTR